MYFGKIVEIGLFSLRLIGPSWWSKTPTFGFQNFPYLRVKSITWDQWMSSFVKRGGISNPYLEQQQRRNFQPVVLEQYEVIYPWRCHGVLVFNPSYGGLYFWWIVIVLNPSFYNQCSISVLWWPMECQYLTSIVLWKINYYVQIIYIQIM